MANAKKPTQAEVYKAIIDTYALSEEHKAFLQKKMEQVEKKNASGADRKPTKAQQENLATMNAIVEGMEANVLYAATDIGKTIPACEGMTPQKITPMMTKLYAAHRVYKVKDKRKTLYRLPNANDVWEAEEGEEE